MNLPLLRAGMAEVALESQLGREFGKSVTRIHLDPIISTAAGVGWLESAVERGAVESNEFVKTVSDAFEAAAGAIDNPVRVCADRTFGLVLANDLLGNFEDSVEDVGECASQLAGGGIFGAWRGLDVGLDRNSHAKCECDQ